MAQLEAAGISSTQQHPLSTSSPQRPFAVEARESTQSIATQGNQTTIHDFLSLCGAATDRYTSTATANHGPQQSSTTQDLLQPLQKSLIPAGSLSTHLRPNGDALGSSNPYVASSEPGGGQQSYYAFGNGGFEPKENFSSKYRSANISCGPKGHVAHTFPLTKHWQQQAGADTFYGINRLSRAPSEEDDDEDDEDLVYSAKKDGRFQKGDNSQPMDGRSVDKGVTPRSKHSATEQRRRSKINDRFQMLRQLLPNADQKRDKASFLLEVIEYIQMLHEKVKKHESLELTGQNQEQTKPLSWDRASGQQDVSSNVAQDMKELPDTIGYVRSRLSPLTVMSEDGMTSPGLTCTMVQASASQAVLNFESKPVITKSIPLNFCSAPPTSIPEQASNHLRQTIMTENQSFFSQFLRHDDQAVTKARDLFSQKTEAMQPQVQQSLSMMIKQHSRQEEDQRFPCSRSMDHKNVASLVFGRAEEEVEAQDRSSQVTEIRPLPGNGVNKPSIGLDVIGVPGCSEQRTEAASAKDQEAPTVLGGVINISSTYSQGLLDTLTRALQSSGVDMTQATISVQIDLGNPESSGLKQMISLPTGISPLQKNLLVSTNESEPSRKKLKVEAD